MAQAGAPSTKTPHLSLVRPAFFSALSDAEGDMRRVYDLALILHDYMEDGKPLDADRVSALSWLTIDLVNIGERLRKHFDAIHEAA